ncbi:hypothetical protein ME121_5177 [Methylobacterium sp. ME121]|nr:hypothetical protein ME121_5177 [Methylobacterium sp. ME121]
MAAGIATPTDRAARPDPASGPIRADVLHRLWSRPMKRLAIALTALSSLVLFAPSSEARPHGRGFHHGPHHLGHGAWRGRRHGLHRHRHHRLHRHYRRHRGYRGYRGVHFRPAGYGYRPYAYRYGGWGSHRGLGFATGAGLGLAAGAARPGLYGAAYGRPYGYRYAPAGYGCAYY